LMKLGSLNEIDHIDLIGHMDENNLYGCWWFSSMLAKKIGWLIPSMSSISLTLSFHLQSPFHTHTISSIKKLQRIKLLIEGIMF
jgi:hypothetical protein